MEPALPYTAGAAGSIQRPHVPALLEMRKPPLAAGVRVRATPRQTSPKRATLAWGTFT